MPRLAAGIVLYRSRSPDLAAIQILLGHIGGPYFAKKDLGGWTLPKGLVEPGEDALTAARREWAEETGTPAPPGDYHALPPIGAGSGKVHYLFLVAGDADPAALVSNTCTIAWPPRSGRTLTFPEIDRFGWYTLAEARVKLSRSLAPVVDEVARVLAP